MAGFTYTTVSVPVSHKSFNGGLNTTSGPLNVADNESPDLLNVDLTTFGSVLKRNGFDNYDSSTSAACQGLHWYEYISSGAYTSKLICLANSKMYKMDDLDGVVDDITGTISVTSDYHYDFENFLNEVYAVNGYDAPVKWTGSGNASNFALATDVTKPKFIKQFNNYMFVANVYVSGIAQTSRIYWSTIKDTATWSALDFIDVSKDDGQEITGLKVLSDRLVVFKSRSIFNVFFTGDPDVPFTVVKTNSSVGCCAPWSIQEAENGLVFLSLDGFYYFDGNNSYRISEKISTTIQSLNKSRFNQAVSLVQRNKNRYWCALPTSSSTTNNRIFVYDWVNAAWTLYSGHIPSAMCMVYDGGIDEKPHFGDYLGWLYRADYGTADNIASVATAINSYYYTNWKSYDDIINQKGTPHTYIYFQTKSAVLTFAYSYDFESVDQYTQTFSTDTSADVYDVAVYGVGKYASTGGNYTRRDLTGRGRVVRFKFANSTINEEFQVDGLGVLPHLETYQ